MTGLDKSSISLFTVMRADSIQEVIDRILSSMDFPFSNVGDQTEVSGTETLMLEGCEVFEVHNSWSWWDRLLGRKKKWMVEIRLTYRVEVGNNGYAPPSPTESVCNPRMN